MTAKYILITGGSGFIGRNLILSLINQQEDLLLLLQSDSKLPVEIESVVTRINCDDWSRKGISSALGNLQFTTIIHLASYGVAPCDRDPECMSNINIMVPVALIEMAAQWEANIVMLGSCSEYGAVEYGNIIDENSKLECSKLYGASKAAGTLYACAAAEHFRVHLRVLRLFNVYGFGEANHRLLPTLINRLKNNEHVSLSLGSQVRDFIYVKDVISAIIHTATLTFEALTDNYAKVWNICSGQPHSVQQFAEMVAAQLDKPISKLGFGDLDMRTDDLDWVLGDPDKIYLDIEWRAQYSLNDGIADTLSQIDKDEKLDK